LSTVASFSESELVLGGLRFPEGLRWHDEELWLADMVARRVLAATLDGRVRRSIAFDDEPAGIGFLPDGTPLVVLMWSKRIVALDGDRPVPYADLSSAPGERANDMVVDALGRVYAGCIAGPAGAGTPQGAIVLAGASPPQVVADGLATPNGLAVTPGGDTLIAAETARSRLLAYPIAADGALGPGEVFAELGGAHPDGICLDASGAVWVGAVFEGEFLRVARGGAVLERVPVPGRWAIAPRLAGDDRRTLLLATARTTVDAMRADGGAEGWVDAVRVTVAGAGRP
jgi:sugar lactone lactonase YvrE